jgi:CheY-like chemotaxis protein
MSTAVVRCAAPLVIQEPNPMPIILIVEDEAHIRQFVAVNLKARGYAVLQAGSAEEGLQQLRDHAPEALILDLKLPGMSGWDMLKYIVSDPELPDIPVIIMTASFPADHTGELIYAHITEKLIKPVSATDLIAAVRKIFG